MARPPYCSIGAGYGAVLPEGMEPGVAPMQGSLGPCNDQPMAETVLIVDDHAPFWALARALLQLLGRPGGGCDLLGHQRAVLCRVRRRMADAARSRPQHADVTPQPWQMVGQLGHNLVIAFALAYVLARLEVRTRKDALRVGLLVWVGFEAMAVAGSVLHEGYPLRVVPDPCR